LDLFFDIDIEDSILNKNIKNEDFIVNDDDDSVIEIPREDNINDNDSKYENDDYLIFDVIYPIKVKKKGKKNYIEIVGKENELIIILKYFKNKTRIKAPLSIINLLIY